MALTPEVFLSAHFMQIKGGYNEVSEHKKIKYYGVQANVTGTVNVQKKTHHQHDAQSLSSPTPREHTALNV